MVVRSMTALFGGYFATSGLASLLARLLPVARVEATAWGMILSFLFYAGIALWAFYEQRLLRVVGVIWGTAIASFSLTLLLGTRT